MVLLKEQFEAAKKNQAFSRTPKTRKRVKEIETGFYNTRKVRCQACKQGFMYRYKWYDEKEDKIRVMTSVNMKRLKEKVKEKNLKWEVDSYYKARITEE